MARITTFTGTIAGRTWSGFNGEWPCSFTVNRNAGHKSPLKYELRNMAGDFQRGNRTFAGWVIVRRVLGRGRYVLQERYVEGTLD